MKNFNRKQWDKIVNDAFSPDAPEPVFSQRYQRIKKEILHQADSSAERKIIMNKNWFYFYLYRLLCLSRDSSLGRCESLSSWS